MSIEQPNDVAIKRQIIELSQSAEFFRLKSFYRKKSYWEILGIARSEIQHSKFLAWLLTPTESHQTGDFSLRNLLKSILMILEKSKQLSPAWLSDDMASAIICGNYELANVKVVTEQSIEGKKRIDIWITAKMKIDGEEPFDLQIVIENKVKSFEHDEQTVIYRQWAEKQNPRAKTICLYLAPVPMLKLMEIYSDENCGKDLKPKDPNFVFINYQVIMDCVLRPLLEEMNNSENKGKIQDYIRCLSFYSIDKNNDGKDEIFMAISAEEKNCSMSFWKNTMTSSPLCSKHWRTTNPSMRRTANFTGKRQKNNPKEITPSIMFFSTIRG